MIGRQPWVVPSTAARFYPRLVKLKFLAKTVSCHTALAARPIETSWPVVARRFDLNALLEQYQHRQEIACEPLWATANAPAGAVFQFMLPAPLRVGSESC